MISISLNDLADKLDFDTPSSLPKLGVYKVALHALQMLLAFITLCITASIISAENEYKVRQTYVKKWLLFQHPTQHIAGIQPSSPQLHISSYAHHTFRIGSTGRLSLDNDEQKGAHCY